MNHPNWQESETLEFKESFAEKESAGKTLVAFANKDGGEIYFGVKNDGTRIGVDNPSEENMRRLEQLFTDNTEPKLYPKIERITENGVLMIHVVVKKSATPYHTFKGDGYIRVGLSDKRMSQDELYTRWSTHRNNTHDSSADICRGLTSDDFDQAALETLRRLWAKKEQNDEYLTFSHEEILQKLLLMRENDFTYSSLLLCGKAKLPNICPKPKYDLDGKMIRADSISTFRKIGELHS